MSTQVPARAQILTTPAQTFYIDGAHTPVSIHRVCEWFEQFPSTSRVIVLVLFNIKDLVFYCGRDKKSLELIRDLVKLPFNHILLSMVKNPKPEYTYCQDLNFIVGK